MKPEFSSQTPSRSGAISSPKKGQESLRVLHLAEGVGFRHGGPGIDLPNYCRAMAAQGAHVTLAVAWSDATDRPESVLGCARWDFGSGGSLEIKGFRALKPHRWRMAPGLALWLWRHVAHFDIVHLHSFYSFPVFQGALLSTLWRTPFVMSTHGVLAPVQRTVSPRLKSIYDRVILKPLLPHTAAIIFSTKREREEAGALVAGLQNAIIPNGISLDRYEQLPPRGSFRERYLGGWSGPLMLYLGRLNAKKGLDILVPAFARAVAQGIDARLAIAGAGDPPRYAETIQHLITEQGLSERVVLTGALNEEEKIAAFADSDAFVLPSRAENFGSAMFEAMACGLPVIVSTGVDLHYEVTAAGAGLAIGLDADRLAEGLVLMIANDDFRMQCAPAAHALAGRYSNTRTAERWIQLYKQIIAGTCRGTTA
jgi:glycosyltransferase involved in cell wall biosynthesis